MATDFTFSEEDLALAKDFGGLARQDAQAQNVELNLEPTTLLSSQPVEAQTSDSFFGRRAQDLIRGVNNLQVMGGGLQMLAGNLTDNPEMEQSGRDSAVIAQRQAQQNAPLVGTYEDVDSIGDGIEYLSSSIVEQLPMWAVTLPAGGIGGGIASKAIGAPLMGAIEKETAKGIAKDLIQKYGIEQAAKKVAIRKEIGLLAGSWGASSAMETGSIAADIDSQGSDNLGISLLAGPLAGAFDAIPNFQILKNSLGRPVAEKAVKYAAERFGKETAQTALNEAGTEGIQTVIEMLAVQVADPTKAQFTDEGWTNVIDSMIKGGFGGGAVAGTVETFNRATLPLVKPSTDPKVNQYEKNVRDKADSMNYEIDEIDLANAQGNPAPSEAQEPPSGPVSEISITETEQGANPLDLIVSDFETSQGRSATDQERALLEESLTVDTRLVDTDRMLDEALLSDQPDETLQEQRKQLQERQRTIKSQLSGYDPASTEPTRTPESTGQPTAIGEKGAQNKAKQWLDKTLMPVFRDMIAPDKGQSKKVRDVKAALVKAITPHAQLFAAMGVQVKSVRELESQEAQDKFWKSKATGFEVSADPKGNLTLYIPEPAKIANRKGISIETSKSLFESQMQEEAVHAAYYVALKDEWKKSKSKQDFVDYVTRKEGQYASAIRRATSNKTLDAFTRAYSLKDKSKLTDSELAAEFIRAVVEKARTGTFSEEVKTLAALADQGNQPAKGLLAVLLDAIQTIRNSLVNFLNPETAPKELRSIIDRTNKVLDKYTPTPLENYAPTTPSDTSNAETNQPNQQEQQGETNSREEVSNDEARPTEAVEAPSAVTTPEETQTDSTANLEPTRPPAERPQPAPVAPTPTAAPERPITPRPAEYNQIAGEMIAQYQQAAADARAAAPEDRAPLLEQLAEMGRSLPLNYQSTISRIQEGPHEWIPGEGLRVKYAPVTGEKRASARSGAEIDDSNFTNDLSDLLQSIADNRPNTQGKVHESAMRDYFGELNNNAVIATRAQKTAFENVANYISRKGVIGAMRNAASGNLGGMSGVDRVLLSGTLAKFAPAMIESIERSAMRGNAQLDVISEVLELRNLIQDKHAEYLANAGREINIMGAVKAYFYDGASAAYDVEKMIFEVTKKAKEDALSKEKLSTVYLAAKNVISKVANRAFTSEKMIAHLSAMIRKASKDPAALRKSVRESLKRNISASKKIAERASAAAGETIIGEDTTAYLKLLASKFAATLNLAAPNDNKIDADKIVSQALTQMARDAFPKPPRATPEIRDKNLRTLHAIIANDNLRNQFIDILEQKVSANFRQGKLDPAYTLSYTEAFQELRGPDYDAKIRERAVNELRKNLSLSIQKMLLNNWSDSKAQVMGLMDSLLGPIASPEVREDLYTQVETELDRQADEHLVNTFGFRRDEGGSLKESKNGQLLGGKGITDALRDLGTRLSDLTKISYEKKDQFINGLAENYTATLGLPDDMAMAVQKLFAQDLAEAVEWKRDGDVWNKFESVLSTLSDQKKRPDTKSTIDELIKLANKGYLDVPLIYESVRRQYNKSNLPEFKPETAQMIRELGDEMSKLPEGFQKDEVRQTIANEMANMSGISAADVATSYFYFSMLSGLSTWLVVNPISNAANTFLTATSLSMDRPERAAKIWSSIIGSITNPKSNAWTRAKYAMETGYIPGDIGAKGMISKFGPNQVNTGKMVEQAQNPFERITPEMGDTWWRRVFYRLARGFKVGNAEISARSLNRFLAATDQFFRVTGRNAALAAYGPQDTTQAIMAAMAQAQSEVGQGLVPAARLALRADEIYTQALGADPQTAYAVARAEQVGLESAFTQTPKGAIGMLARFLGTAGGKYPIPFRIIFPFTNIVANVWNESLNYSPIGAGRWALAKISPDKYGSEWTIVDEKGNDVADSLLLKKAVLGTASVILVGAIFGREDDELDLYGFGPKDKAARQAFLDRGLKPFSMRVGNVRINYQYLGPLSLPISLVGSMLDIGKDSQGKDIKAENVLFGAMSSILANQFQQSFLSSFSSMIESVYSTDPGGSLKKWASFQAGTAMPNIVKQVYNEWIDRDQYRSSSFFGQVGVNLAVTKSLSGEKALNYFGDPLQRKELPVFGRAASWLGGDEVIQDIDSLGLRLPGYTNRINNQPMDDAQVSQYRKLAGPQLKQSFQALMPALERLVANGRNEQAQGLLDNAAQKINKVARDKMLQTIDNE